MKNPTSPHDYTILSEDLHFGEKRGQGKIVYWCEDCGKLLTVYPQRKRVYENKRGIIL